jgi:antitoxin (DNA-binding transcriptional repressor) of toxin-antitoxin stability system
MKYRPLLETDVSLNALVNEITANQSEVVITRNGFPVARIVPWQTTPTTNAIALQYSLGQ